MGKARAKRPVLDKVESRGNIRWHWKFYTPDGNRKSRAIPADENGKHRDYEASQTWCKAKLIEVPTVVNFALPLARGLTGGTEKNLGLISHEDWALTLNGKSFDYWRTIPLSDLVLYSKYWAEYSKSHFPSQLSDFYMRILEYILRCAIKKEKLPPDDLGTFAPMEPSNKESVLWAEPHIMGILSPNALTSHWKNNASGYLITLVASLTGFSAEQLIKCSSADVVLGNNNSFISSILKTPISPRLVPIIRHLIIENSPRAPFMPQGEIKPEEHLQQFSADFENALVAIGLSRSEIHYGQISPTNLSILSESLEWTIPKKLKNKYLQFSDKRMAFQEYLLDRLWFEKTKETQRN